MTISSPFLQARRDYPPKFPSVLANVANVAAEKGEEAASDANKDQIEKLKKIFENTWGQSILNLIPASSETSGEKKRVGVVLSGGQAPGGHNVISGIFDALMGLSPNSVLLGFNKGPSGILEDDYTELTKAIIDEFRNTGGFDLLGSGRTKISTPEQFAKCREIVDRHRLDALVVIGGDDSNTNAALLAEYFKKEGSPTQVIGVPKTIDGDLKNQYVEASFGFDTAVRVYSELIANLERDALSARKYYHFVRLMGRSASHITLEAAFQTQPNIALVGEEIADKQMTLKELVEHISQIIVKRAEDGKNYGIVLVPEGLIEFIPEMGQLISELNQLIAEHKNYMDSLHGFTAQSEYINGKLSKDASYTFSGLPIDIQRQLLMDRDPHGNVQVSQIETEKLLIELLTLSLGEKKAEGHYKGNFATQHHFFGYEGRCAAPTNFDADYAYCLGRNAVALIHIGVTGYMSVVNNLSGPKSEWQACGVPLTSMMNLEIRNGKEKPVIRKGLVDLNSKAFAAFQKARDNWAENDCYRFCGPIQYFGNETICDKVPFSLAVEFDRQDSQPW